MSSNRKDMHLKDMNGNSAFIHLYSDITEVIKAILDDEESKKFIGKHVKNMNNSILAKSEKTKLNLKEMLSKSDVAYNDNLPLIDNQKGNTPFHDMSDQMYDKICHTMLEKIPSHIFTLVEKTVKNTILPIFELGVTPEQIISKITQQSLNKLLNSIPYGNFSIKDLKVNSGQKPSLRCDCTFEFDPLLPYFKVTSTPPLTANPLLEVVFEVYVHGTLSGVGFYEDTEKDDKLIVDFGVINLNVEIKPSSLIVMNHDVISEDLKKNIFTKEIKKEMPKITL